VLKSQYSRFAGKKDRKNQSLYVGFRFVNTPHAEAPGQQ
jgi:hypothetical protein